MTLRGRGSGRSGFRLRTLTRGLALVLLAAPLMGCSLFHKDEDYVPDKPADKLYNEGLFLLNNKQDYKEAAKKFDEVDRQNPYSDWARKALLMSAYAYYQAEEYDDCDQRGEALRDAASRQPGRGLRAVPDRLVVLRPDPRRHPRSGTRREGDRRARGGGAQISGHANTPSSAKKKIEMARDQLAGKEMEIGRFYMKRRDFTGAINRFKVVVTQYQTTRQVEEALDAADRGLCGARHHRRGADRGRRARPQFPGQPLVQGRLHAW